MYKKRWTLIFYKSIYKDWEGMYLLNYHYSKWFIHETKVLSFV